MNGPCIECRNGPRGAGGHESLFAHRLDGDVPLFECRACGRIWVLEIDYGSESVFAWRSLAPHEVPARVARTRRPAQALAHWVSAACLLFAPVFPTSAEDPESADRRSQHVSQSTARKRRRDGA